MRVSEDCHAGEGAEGRTALDSVRGTGSASRDLDMCQQDVKRNSNLWHETRWCHYIPVIAAFGRPEEVGWIWGRETGRKGKLGFWI